MRSVGRFAIVVAALALVPGTASAHGVRTDAFDAPVPLDLVLLGAALTVGLTGGWLLWHGQFAGSERRRSVGSIPPRAARVLRVVARVGFLVLFVAVLAAGLFGRQVRAENPATLFVWPVWFEGIALLAIVAGSPWRVLAPWRTIYEGLVWLEGREIALVGGYPERVGAWPALLGYVGLIGIVANLTVIPDSPRKTAIVVAGGTLVLVLGGLCFGRTWFRNADPFDVFYRLLGRVAPLSVDLRDDGGCDLGLRPPWTGCSERVAGVAVAAFVVSMVYTVSFDGFANTQRYQRLLFDLRDLLGTGPGTSTILYLGGLVAFLLAYLLAVWLVAALGARASPDREREWIGIAVAFAPTLVPIAAGYEVAHTYTYVLRNLDRLLVELARPVASGVEQIEPLAGLSLGAFWGSQIALIVLGHVVAIVAAHAVALDRFDSEAAARRGHLPLVVVMIGYTVLSLWIVSQPVIGG